MKPLISIILACLLLISSSGITYAQHYCGDYEMLSKLTLGEKHLSCGMVMDSASCDEEAEDHHCCKNEYTQVDTDETFVKAQYDLKLNIKFVTSLVAVFELDLIDALELQKEIYSEYNPPPLVKDIPVLYETFLI